MVAAFIYGLIAGAALLLGAVVGLIFDLSPKISATIMAFGSGVLISALTFDLIGEAYRVGGIVPVSIGFIAGALAFVIADWVIGLWGGHHRKRFKGKKSDISKNNSVAIAVGALLDGVPESVMIGTGLVAGGSAGILMFAAVFLSNIPEGISGIHGITRAKKSELLAMGVWTFIAIACGISSYLGFRFLAHAPVRYLAVTQSIAAGSILAMITDTMIPEAYEEGGVFIALATVFGFLAAFIISRTA